jgi:uncharacterized membrane protein
MRGLLIVIATFCFVLLPLVAEARRSGASFGGRSGFRSGGGQTAMPRSYSRGYGGGGHSFFFFPGFGFGGYGMGGGGMGLFGTLLIVGVLGYATLSVVRAVRRHRQASEDGGYGYSGGYDDDEPAVMPGRAYVYKLQVALGRSARGIQQRLDGFAAQGDTSSEAGLARLLQQTSLELMREKDSIRYAGAEGSGPMSLTNAETRLNGLSLAERSRFEVERVRAVDGKMHRASETPQEGKEALEYVLVTLGVATRTQLKEFKPIASHTELDPLLAELGSVPSTGLLGLEVVWTPADPEDSMTETDLMTMYPDLRSL